MQWKLLNNQEIRAAHTLRTTEAYWMLAGDDGRIYTVLRPAQGEPAVSWLGRASLLAYRQSQFDGKHPLLSRGDGAEAKVCLESAAPLDREYAGVWLPAYGYRPHAGEPLAEQQELTLATFRSVLLAVIDLLRVGHRQGFMLAELAPEQCLMDGDRLTFVDCMAGWEARHPGLNAELTEVVGHFMHRLLCKLQQARTRFPPVLWMICADAMDGAYRQSGLVKLERSLRAALPGADEALAGERGPLLLVDLEGLAAATGAMIDPWRVLEVLTGQTGGMGGLLMLYEQERPYAEWTDAGFTVRHLTPPTPDALVAMAHQQFGRGGELLVVSRESSRAAIEAAGEANGYRCRVIGFGGNGPERQIVDSLRRALYLA